MGRRADPAGVYCAAQVHGILSFLPLDGGNGVQLITDEGFITATEIDDTHVYWVNRPHATLRRIRKDGSDPTTLSTIPSELGMGGGLALDAERAYVTAGTGSMSAILSVPLAGGDPSVLVQVNDTITDVVSDGVHVYWSGLSSIWKVPVGGGTAQPLAAEPTMHPCGRIALHGDHVYWADGSHGTILQIQK
jgi:hypothetical protein